MINAALINPRPSASAQAHCPSYAASGPILIIYDDFLYNDLYIYDDLMVMIFFPNDPQIVPCWRSDRM